MLLLVGCQAVEEGRRRVRGLLGLSVPTPPAEAPEYAPAPPPALEDDKVMQLTPKAKLLALLGQALDSGDATARELFLEDLAAKRDLFGAARDPELASALNRAIPAVQAADRNTLQLLVSAFPLLVGENKDHLRTILGRALDHAPALALPMIAKSGQDRLCLTAASLPEEVGPEAKRTFFETRLAGLSAARAALGSDAVTLALLDACERSLQLELEKIPAPAPVADPDAAVPVP